MNKNLINKIVIVSTVFLFIGSVIVFAASSSTFTTSLTTTGVYSQPPTVPADLDAIPMSPTQIDLSWSPSTGYMYGVDGYQVFRDSVFIATTTSTLYIDNDVSPSTGYTYQVTAFDTMMNISNLSLPVSTTTLSVPTYIPAAGNIVSSSGSTIANLSLYNVSIEPGTNLAKISFDTNVPTRAKLFWGLTSELESVSLSGLFYENLHELQIVGLTPDTKYYLRIQVADIFGRSIYIDYIFNTTGLVSIQQLPNPSNFSAIGYSDHVGLSWVNPEDSRFAKVRIVRSENFYPRDQYDGAPIYEGTASKFTDNDVVAGKKYFYAIFSVGREGSFSSGALAQADVSGAGGNATNINGNPFATIQESTQVDPMINTLKFSDFIFIQDGKLLVPSQNTVAISAGENLTVKLAYDRVPEILKNIVFAISDPKDASKVFTFLLRVNKDKTDFEATIGPLKESNTFGLNIMVLDFQNKGLKKLQGSLVASVDMSELTSGQRYDVVTVIFFFLLLIILSIILYFMKKLMGGKKSSEESAEERNK